MTSQVIVNIDTKLKNRAMKRAKNHGTTLSAVLKSSVAAYALGEIDFGLKEKFNAKTRREVEEALSDISKGKNLSPVFSSVAEMRKYLDN
jgi:antitoxin component of RelBE/YafQ-DinJ toxin-antitoxin module